MHIYRHMRIGWKGSKHQKSVFAGCCSRQVHSLSCNETFASRLRLFTATSHFLLKQEVTSLLIIIINTK